MKTTLKLLIVTCLVLTASMAFAGDWWGRSTRSNNRYSSHRRTDDFYAFPQQNTYIYRQDYGSGISVYSSGPLVQYGADTPLYTAPMKNGFYWVR